MKHLIGHVSPETAFVVEDYPYGFRLRCKIRYWLEYKAGFGFRFMSQTTNPKQPGVHWNKPKASTYAPLAVMVQLDPNTRGISEVTCLTLPAYSIEEKLEAFVAAHDAALQGDIEQGIIAGYRAAIQRYHAACARRDADTGKGERNV